jgi:hypothetical protein
VPGGAPGARRELELGKQGLGVVVGCDLVGALARAHVCVLAATVPYGRGRLIVGGGQRQKDAESK